MASERKGILRNISFHLMQIIGVAVLASGEFRRNLDMAVSGFVNALALTVLLYFLLQNETAFLLVATGFTIAGSFNAGGTVANRVVFLWRYAKALDAIMVSGLKPWNFVLGATLAAFTFGFASDFLYISVISVIVGKPEIALLALVFAPFMSFLGALIGMNIAFRIKSHLKTQTLYGMIFFNLFYLPPVFYPVVNMPEPLRPLVFLAPTGLGAETLRVLTGVSEPVYSLEILLGALFLWLVILLVLSIKGLKWDLD
ncbi:MAG: ABC transporter permease [Acidilobaceae archaeon]